MAKKNIADKYWIYGEDAELAARLTSYLTRVVYNQRANYIRALMKIKEHECSIEDCDSDIESQSMRSGNSLEESIEAKLMWEAIRKYLPKALLVEIILGFDKAAQITFVNICTHIGQRPDAVQFRVVRVGNVGDFVFFHPHRASPRFGLFLVLGVSSVSTYSEITLSALW